MNQTAKYTIPVIKTVLQTSDIKEVEKISLFVKEQHELYTKNELSRIMIMISNRLIELCNDAGEK